MEVWHGIEADLPQGACLALGNFDGVHLGHQELISQVTAAARAAGVESLVVTFDPHPALVIEPGTSPGLITDKRRKAQLIAALGVDGVSFLPFTREFALLTPAAFVREVLWPVFRPRLVAVGFNFSFGCRGTGNAEQLSTLGRELGFAVQVVAPVKVDGELVSSTAIRKLLAAGDLAAARRLLGRWPVLAGAVVPGDRRGRALGFPTANLQPPAGLQLPRQGVYACLVSLSGSQGLLGLANIGQRPTFGPHLPPGIEVHILGFKGDLYGQEMAIELRAFLRPEQRFASAAELVRQIRADIRQARRILEV